jgi:hypothetical protein
VADSKIWARLVEGDFAHVTRAELDRLSAFGWQETGEPRADEFVWMSHPDPDIAEPARFAWGSRSYWLGRGWVPSTPPGHVDLTRDPAAVQQPASDPKSTASGAKATAADKKE